MLKCLINELPLNGMFSSWCEENISWPIQMIGNIFTAEEWIMCGFPNKLSDQDTYRQLMTMEDKEIRFWEKHPEGWKIPFLDECEMNLGVNLF